MKAHRNLIMICGALAALLVPTIAKASSLSIYAGDPQLPGVVSSVWRSPRGDVVYDFQMPVDGTMTAHDMAQVVSERLHSIPGVDPWSLRMKVPAVVGYVPEPRVDVESTPWLDPRDGVPAVDPFDGVARLDPLDGVSSIYWTTGSTAQDSMKLVASEISHATFAAAGHFDPYYQPGQPAVFTAGIVTAVGELTAQVSAQELNFQTDGPIICQALFQRLAPRARQYGAQINYAGDRLEIYFDPAYTIGRRGIIFGTTSPSEGYSGTITFSRAVPEPANLALILIGTFALASRRKNASANQPFAT